jgi:ATP-binding cassette, subfamily B, bacterial PglK
MLSMIRQLADLLSRRERLQLAGLCVATLVAAFLEMISVAAILPFLSVAADPGRIETNAWLSWAYDSLGFTSANAFLLALAGAALLALLVSNAWMAAAQWAQIRFAAGRNHTLAVRLLRYYLDQPYVFFLRRNSADLGKNLLNEIGQVTNQVLMSGLQVLARAVVALAIVALLVAFDPWVALFVTTVLGSAYGVLYLLVRRRLVRLGSERLAANSARFRDVNEAFGGIKDVKLLGREDRFLARFADPSQRLARCLAASGLIASMPRYGLEVLAFGGVLLIGITIMLRGEGLQQMLPMLGLYAFAGHRLMPSLQQVFQNFTMVRFGLPALDNLHRELRSIAADGSAPQIPCFRHTIQAAPGVLPLAEKLELEGVTFTYPGAHRPTLRDVRLTIAANTTVGFVGQTGSGKTTLIDVILGLLCPEAGEIRVDGLPLTDANLRAWQNNLGYVPQHIYLSDASVARNIAFGIPDAEIDYTAVERAARMANIHNLVLHELPEGYATVVGERGVRLSGGQRQRIGIARALYHDPGVLVFDEATSALDHDTEAAVMEALTELAGTRSILMIAHRLTTLRGCDQLVRLENGSVQNETAGRDRAIARVGA